MAKEVKFTEKELQSLTDLQTKYNSVTHKFGQLAIAKLNIEKQTKEVEKVKNKNLLVGAAIGTSDEDLYRAHSLIDCGVDLIVIDTAHGHSDKVLKTLSKIKKKEL